MEFLFFRILVETMRMKKELLNPKWLMRLSFLLISAAIFLFSVTSAFAKPDAPVSTLHEEKAWVHVQDSKVYYFDEKGRLCYRNLSDANYRSNPY